MRKWAHKIYSATVRKRHRLYRLEYELGIPIPFSVSVTVK